MTKEFIVEQLNYLMAKGINFLEAASKLPVEDRKWIKDNTTTSEEEQKRIGKIMSDFNF